MARWQRDPRARRNMAVILAITEVFFVLLVFLAIFFHGLVRVFLRLHVQSTPEAILGMSLGATAALAAWLVFQALQYVKGRGWARAAFIAINAILVLTGTMWFAMHQMMQGTDPEAVLYGLALPMVTVFPLMGFLLAFRPAPPAERGF